VKTAVCLILISASAGAADLSLKGSYYDFDNGSYLSDTKYQPPSYIPDFLSKKRQLELQQQYQDMNRDYDMRSTYGLTDQFAEWNHTNTMASFGNDIFRQVEQFQLQQMRDDASQKLKNNDDIKPVVKPAAIVGGAYMFGTGHPFTFNVADGANVVTRTSVRDQQASIGVVSSQVNCSVQVSETAPTSYNGIIATPTDPSQHDERYKVNISKPLSALQLTPSVYYGSTSTELMIGATKQVYDHVSVRYSHNIPMDPVNSDYHYTEDVVSVNYGIHF
jgi:hypothetical protein